jgi:hypothetical protein
MQGQDQARSETEACDSSKEYGMKKPVYPSAASTFESRPIHGDGLIKLELMKTTATLLLAQFQVIAANGSGSESSRAIALAKTKLEESMMWATKAISRL